MVVGGKKEISKDELCDFETAKNLIASFLYDRWERLD